MTVYFGSLFLVVAAFLCHAADSERKENQLIIPRALVPSEYDLTFDVDLTNEENLFQGIVIIRAQCISPTNEIILNVKDLIIDEETVEVRKELSDSEDEIKESSDNRDKTKKSSYKYKRIPLEISPDQIKDTERERHIIQLEEPLQAEEIIRVIIKYRKSTDLENDQAFIRYSYRNTNGHEESLGVTTSGPINARRLYPCIDEVDMKAEFKLKIQHNSHLIGIINSYKPGDESDAEGVEIQAMSTYSMGFVVGNMKIFSMRNDVILWMKYDTVEDQLKYASITVNDVYKFYQSQFNLSPILSQLNIVALPNYGFVDKWKFGMVTLDESLITNQNPKNEIRKMEITMQLCDILCHQYFGPQTTLYKWNENWLNMGFALYFRNPCLRNILKEQATSFENIQLVESFIRVMDIDAEIKSHPVMPPDNVINLNNLFKDSLQAEIAHFYVRMMNYHLGDENLHNGVLQYLSESKLNVIKLEEVWNFFRSKVTSYHNFIPYFTTLKGIMDSWINKKGYPRIRMTRNSERQLVTIKQESPHGANPNDSRIIPLNFVTKTEMTTDSSEDKGSHIWMESQSESQLFVKNKDWIILDMKLKVLCRVMYDMKTLELLQKTLFHKNSYKIINVWSRVHLISDIFAFAWMGELTYLFVLPTMKYLSHEESYLPMMVAFHELIKIRSALLGTNARYSFQNYIQTILQPIFERKEFSSFSELTEKDYEDYYFKKLVVGTSCLFGLEKCVLECILIFDKWRLDEEPQKVNPIPEGLREIVYCQAIKESTNNQEWDYLWDLHTKESATYSKDFLKAFGCSSDTEKLQMYLDWSIEKDDITPEDNFTVFESVASNKRGYSLATKYLEGHLNQIMAINKRDPAKVYHYFEKLYEITWKMDDLMELDRIVLSVSEKLKNIVTHLVESKSKAERNIKWVEREADIFSSYLI